MLEEEQEELGAQAGYLTLIVLRLVMVTNSDPTLFPINPNSKIPAMMDYN